jgi:hypothetical protein
MLVKAGIAWIAGGGAMGRRVAAAFAFVLLVAAVASGLRWL